MDKDLTQLRYYIGNIMCARRFCMEESQWVDAIGLHWCQKHHDRLLLVRYGQQNGWVAIFKNGYCLLPEGMESYHDAVIAWPGERILPIVDEIRLFVSPGTILHVPETKEGPEIREERASYTTGGHIA